MSEKTMHMSAAEFRNRLKRGEFSDELPTESEEQQKLFSVIKACRGAMPELCMAFHVPNEGKRSITGGGRAVSEGLVKGVPDIFLDTSHLGFHGLRIELKRKRGYKISDEQIEWINNLEKCGYASAFCFGWEEAWELMHGYITDKRETVDRYRSRSYRRCG